VVDWKSFLQLTYFFPIEQVIPEVIELKWELFQRLLDLSPAHALVASNTSTFPASLLLEKTPLLAPRFIITHFCAWVFLVRRAALP
jgi:3-hydroxyacyl-CoA dehydrogenase